MGNRIRGREPRDRRMEVRLTETEFERWDNLAELTGRTASDLIRSAMEMFFDILNQWEVPRGNGK